jgi:hypothetical protein
VRWAAERKIHIDRVASAWLIRRFVDPATEFFRRQMLLGKEPA